LGLFETLEALAFQRRVFSVANSALDFTLAIRLTTRHGKATAP
jgi:hypothetical protein